MNKKGITPIIAVVLLLMMTVAAAGAAFYWLTRMQQQAQAGVTGQQQQLIEQASAAVSLVSQSYNADSTTGGVENNLSIDMQNTGGRSISLANDSIIMVLEDGDGNAVCPSEDLDSVQFSCYSGCGAAVTLGPNEVKRLIIQINETATGCTALADTNTYYYQLKLQKGATVSGSFRHE